MGPFWAPCDSTPLTNRGVELAEACFRGAESTDRGPHVLNTGDPGHGGGTRALGPRTPEN